jgi:capsular polysaccharide biosynthesis protein
MELNGGTMSQQALDLRSAIKTVRKHRMIFGVIVVLGLLIGGAYAVVKPPMISSTALVVLPGLSAQNAQSSATGTGEASDTFIDTQVVIAGSDPVLSAALPNISPATSFSALQGEVQVSSTAGSIISFSASGKNAGQAETTANAVANSYIAYVSSSANPVGHVSAKVLQSASTASGMKLPEWVALWALLGALGGALIGFIVSLAFGRGDRKLIERDAIANSIGAPVLASLPVEHPKDAVSWANLFEQYEPGDVDAWSLTKLLRQLGVGDSGLPDARKDGRSALTVLTVASDPKALALGPQLAVFAASQGISTALVIGPQQDENVTATLRTACAAPSNSGGRRKPLQLVVSDDGYVGRLDATFVVVVAVVDGRTPAMPDTVRTSATVLGVTAGAATAEELARAATAAAVDGREVVGILVANPERTDQTSGRIPRLATSLRRPMPTRVNDVPTEIRR